MAIGLRRKKLLQAGFLGAGIMLVVSTTSGYFLYQKVEERELELKQEYREKLLELETVAKQSNRAYAVVKDVKKGELITLEDVQEVFVPEGAHADDSILYTVGSGSTLKNFYAKTDIAANTIVTSSLVYQDENVTHDVREGEYAFIEMPLNINAEQYVDIRIQFPTGDDFIFLSKKKLKEIVGSTVRFDLDEGEILTMSSAIVDAYIEGAKIYAMPYVDEHMQKASEVTYPVKENVQQLIKESPNIVNFAKLNLEQQNRLRLENNIDALEPLEKEMKKSQEELTKHKQQAETDRIDAEARINEMNEQGQSERQQSLVGGDSSYD